MSSRASIIKSNASALEPPETRHPSSASTRNQTRVAYVSPAPVFIDSYIDNAAHITHVSLDYIFSSFRSEYASMGN